MNRSALRALRQILGLSLAALTVVSLIVLSAVTAFRADHTPLRRAERGMRYDGLSPALGRT